MVSVQEAVRIVNIMMKAKAGYFSPTSVLALTALNSYGNMGGNKECGLN